MAGTWDVILVCDDCSLRCYPDWGRVSSLINASLDLDYCGNTSTTNASVQHSPANLPDDSLGPITSVAKTGIYYGFARVHPDHEGSEAVGTFTEADLAILPMVMSLGWNPYYKNEKLTAVCVCTELDR